MKITAIGDTHGGYLWKSIVNREIDSDIILLIGDFFDNFNKTSYIAQIDNFRDIIQFKKANKDKVIVLLGNHDFHYIHEDRCAGYQDIGADKIGAVINSAINDNFVQMCYVHENIIFTHAGVSKTWCYNNMVVIDENISEAINNRFKYSPMSFAFHPGSKRDKYGDEPSQTPLWIRLPSLRRDKISGYIQVVGHTPSKKLEIKDDVICIDCLSESQQYLVITDDEFTIKSCANSKLKHYKRTKTIG